MHDALLFWDFAKTFLREWSLALSWELKTAPLIVAIVLGYQFAWHDWFRLGMAAVICGGFGTGYLLCKSGFSGSIRHKVACWSGLALLAALTGTAPYLLSPFIRGDDSLRAVDIIGYTLVSGLLLIHSLRNGRWPATGSNARPEPTPKAWAVSWAAVIVFVGIPMVSLLKLHELRFFPYSPFWLLMGAVHFRKIWAETQDFMDLATYVYPHGRR